MLVCVDQNILEIIQYICYGAPKSFNYEKVAQRFMSNTRSSERILDSRNVRQRNQIVCDSVIFHFLCQAGAPLSLFYYEHQTLNEDGYSSGDDPITGEHKCYPTLIMTILTSTITGRDNWPDASIHNWVLPIITPSAADDYSNKPLHSIDNFNLDEVDPDELHLTWRELDGLWWRNYRCASLVTAVRLLNLGKHYKPLETPSVAMGSPLSDLLPVLDHWSECNHKRQQFTVLELYTRLKQQVELNLPANKSLKNMLAFMLRQTALWTSINRQLERKSRLYTLAIFKLVIGVLPAFPTRRKVPLLGHMLHGLNIGFNTSSLGTSLADLHSFTNCDSSRSHGFINDANKRRKF